MVEITWLGHNAWSIQSHVLRFTTLNVDGFKLTMGDGSVNESEACRASAPAPIAGAPARGGDAVGNQDNAPL